MTIIKTTNKWGKIFWKNVVIFVLKYVSLTLCWCKSLHLSRCLIDLVTSFHRFREVLATNNIMPWELVSVFKRVLRDFLNQKKYDEDNNPSVQPIQLQPMESWTSRYRMKQRFVTPAVPSCGENLREEIPTISGYVDWAMRHSSSFTAKRDWDLSYYYEVPHSSTGTYNPSSWGDKLWSYDD